MPPASHHASLPDGGLSSPSCSREITGCLPPHPEPPDCTDWSSLQGTSPELHLFYHIFFLPRVQIQSLPTYEGIYTFTHLAVYPL